jgi:hypothetical protein
MTAFNTADNTLTISAPKFNFGDSVLCKKQFKTFRTVMFGRIAERCLRNKTDGEYYWEYTVEMFQEIVDGSLLVNIDEPMDIPEDELYPMTYTLQPTIVAG